MTKTWNCRQKPLWLPHVLMLIIFSNFEHFIRINHLAVEFRMTQLVWISEFPSSWFNTTSFSNSTNAQFISIQMAHVHPMNANTYISPSTNSTKRLAESEKRRKETEKRCSVQSLQTEPHTTISSMQIIMSFPMKTRAPPNNHNYIFLNSCVLINEHFVWSA